VIQTNRITEEEYGWRGYLHNELAKLRPRLGVFWVGLIWGIWHFPIIMSGIHTYQPNPNGLFLGVLFFILTGYVFGYAVMKTKSIWVVTFMHGVMNSIYPFTLNYIVRPQDKVFSLGLGVYGLCCLGIVVLLLLRDPVWQSHTDELGRLTGSK
jgi:membrane protease YdiL (CAAX protease family)